MATVRILQNVFAQGVIRFRAGDIVEVDLVDVESMIRRGWASPEEKPPIPVTEATVKRKGK